ncbi:MAG: KOW domain-containing RNA-binding protein [Bilifractor sp.]|nr:KOW domain-containing RNA-binding protein [Lachnospiraceae bacterium]MDY2837083.1 KOW domain-containing RNA-binding protein [Bilifractor sp.]
MRQLKEGMYARSLAGHDKGRLYIVSKVSGDDIWLTDGAGRNLAHPKKKKRIHIQPCFQTASSLKALILKQQTLTDTDIRNALKCKEEL